MDPFYSPVGELFRDKKRYRIPKYQRSYAWEESEINVFLNDLFKCYNERKFNKPKEHFFGGIVLIEQRIAPGKHDNIVIDGQQRLATFVLLGYALLEIYQEILSSLSKLPVTGERKKAWVLEKEDFLESKINDMNSGYIRFDDTINLKRTHPFVLELSKTDKEWFQKLISGENLTINNASSDSHKRILKALHAIRTKLESLIGNITYSEIGIQDSLKNLQTIEEVINIDFKILQLVSSNSRQAYTLFQVLNNRGKNLAEGDLLRAITMEKLDDPAHLTVQDQVEELWDEILTDSSETTDMVFRCIYASYTGELPGSNTLFEDLESEFFPDLSSDTIDNTIAQNILNSVKSLHQDFWIGTTILDGDWIYEDLSEPNAPWNQGRLNHLMRTLRHKDCLPLLIAASTLNEDKFAKIVSILERFYFRYFMIGDQYIGRAAKIYLAEAEKIRAQGGYNVDSLREALRPLLAKVDNTSFRNGLKGIRFDQAPPNKVIKYFLETLEHYYKWYHDGANGNPTCREKNRVFSQSGSSIEHLYPKKAHQNDLNQELEPDLKHGIGNLCFMDRKDNERLGNKPFPEKRDAYQKSSILMLKEVGQKADWTIDTYESWEKKLLDMACKIFKI